MAFPSDPVEIQIDPTDGDQSNCSPPTTSGDTIRLGNNGNVYGVQHGQVFSKNGPYEYNGKLWAAFVDTLSNNIEVWSTSDGSTWAEVDPDDHPACKANTGDEEIDSGGAFPEFGAETVSVAARLIAPDPPDEDWYAALYVGYINTSGNWALGVFNLDTEAWETDDFIASAIDPIVGSGSTMRPNSCLEYRAVNDDLVLFWQSFDDSDNEAVYRVVITTSFGSPSVFTGGSSVARILYGSTVVSESGRIYIETVSGTLSKVYVKTFAADNSSGSEQQIGEEDTGAFDSRAWGGQLTARSDGEVVATWYRRREQTAFAALEFQIHASFSGSDSASPTWTDTTVHDWSGSVSELYPIAVETTDEELYCLWTGRNIDSSERVLKYSLWDDDLSSWSDDAALVDISLPLAGVEACENELSLGAYSALPIGDSFGVIFDRGTASFDPDAVEDPRGARYDYSLQVWFFGSPPEGGPENLYTPLGPYAPYVL